MIYPPTFDNVIKHNQFGKSPQKLKIHNNDIKVKPSLGIMTDFDSYPMKQLNQLTNELNYKNKRLGVGSIRSKSTNPRKRKYQDSQPIQNISLVDGYSPPHNKSNANNTSCNDVSLIGAGADILSYSTNMNSSMEVYAKVENDQKHHDDNEGILRLYNDRGSIGSWYKQQRKGINDYSRILSTLKIEDPVMLSCLTPNKKYDPETEELIKELDKRIEDESFYRIKGTDIFEKILRNSKSSLKKRQLSYDVKLDELIGYHIKRSSPQYRIRHNIGKRTYTEHKPDDETVMKKLNKSDIRPKSTTTKTCHSPLKRKSKNCESFLEIDIKAELELGIKASEPQQNLRKIKLGNQSVRISQIQQISVNECKFHDISPTKSQHISPPRSHNISPIRSHNSPQYNLKGPGDYFKTQLGQIWRLSPEKAFMENKGLSPTMAKSSVIENDSKKLPDENIKVRMIPKDNDVRFVGPKNLNFSPNQHKTKLIALRNESLNLRNAIYNDIDRVKNALSKKLEGNWVVNSSEVTTLDVNQHNESS